MTVNSCQEKQLICESFDFDKVYYDTSYFFQPLAYSNGIDTILLPLVSKESSEETVWGSYGIDCNPEFVFSKRDKNMILNLTFGFRYYDNGSSDSTCYLDLMVNSGNILINVDSIQEKPNTEMIFRKITNLGTRYQDHISEIKLKNLRVTQVKTKSGEIWSLIAG